jgi:hypothetical protein
VNVGICGLDLAAMQARLAAAHELSPFGPAAIGGAFSFPGYGVAGAYRCGQPPTEQSPGLGTSLFGGGGTDDGGGEVFGVPPAHSGRYSVKLNFVEQADSRAAANISTITRYMA